MRIFIYFCARTGRLQMGFERASRLARMRRELEAILGGDCTARSIGLIQARQFRLDAARRRAQ